MKLFPATVRAPLRALGGFASAALVAGMLAGTFTAPALAGDDCGAEIEKLKPLAEQLSDADKKSEVEKLLQQAHEELVTEADAEECMDKVADAKDVLGVSTN